MKDGYRVIQWGIGSTGTHSLKYVLTDPKLELVGLKCCTPEKDGRNAGELCGLEASAVKASRDTQALLALEADCVIFMPRDPLADPSMAGSPSRAWFDELILILASGKNVVTSICSGTHYRHLHDGEDFLRRINEACERGRSSVFFTGFDPGFSDTLAFAMSGAVGRITQIRTWEMVDYSTYPSPETLQALGFGARPQDLSAEAMGVVRTTWGGVPYLMAEALGVELDGIEMEADIYLSPITFTAPGGLTVKEGTIGALRFSLIGMVGGKPAIAVHHVNRIGQDMAPDWPRIGTDGGYRVEIDGDPPFRGDFPMGLAGGTGATFSDALAMTAARCVNSIEAVVRAEPGYRTFLDLPPLGGRHALSCA